MAAVAEADVEREEHIIVTVLSVADQISISTVSSVKVSR